MNADEPKRISRLTAILTQLQSKQLVTATALAKKFRVSVRTIYRDMRTLEESGVPVITDEGRGYSIMEHYRMPPVMFSEREAFALITAEQIIRKHKDASLIKEFTEALVKIKTALNGRRKEETELLEKRMYVGKNFHSQTTSNNLLDLQMAVIANKQIEITYRAENNNVSTRTIEPYLLYHTDTDDWTLIANCLLRKDFRTFRIDRITSFSTLAKVFKPQERRFKRYIDKKYPGL